MQDSVGEETLLRETEGHGNFFNKSSFLSIIEKGLDFP